MAKADVLDILRSKKMDPLEFHFENLWIPPMNCYLTQQDIDQLRSIATSVRLSSKITKKYEMIDEIMTRRGFKRFSAGTNRVVYRFIDDTRFLVKIAVDKVGMQDNPLEYKNQFLLQPFVTKMFYVSPCGTVGFSERVLPVKNKAEFKEIASDVFDILVNKILGLYVVEDVGNKYFMNWGIRPGFGPVLLDYPYVYKLDGKKLYCSKIDPDTHIICDGEIDYDVGFNHLICSKCGKVYLATDLRDDNDSNTMIIKKGGNEMRIAIMCGDEVVAIPIPADEVMTKPVTKFTTPKGFIPPLIGVETSNGIIECDRYKISNNDEYHYEDDDDDEDDYDDDCENYDDEEEENNESDVNETEEEIPQTPYNNEEIIEDSSNDDKEEVKSNTNQEEEVSTKYNNDFPIIRSKFMNPDLPVSEDHPIDEVESSNTESNYESDTVEAEEDNDEDEAEDQFASDIEIERRNKIARMDKTNKQIIIRDNGNGGSKKKKKNKHKNKNNSQYISSTNPYRKG